MTVPYPENLVWIQFKRDHHYPQMQFRIETVRAVDADCIIAAHGVGGAISDMAAALAIWSKAPEGTCDTYSAAIWVENGGHEVLAYDVTGVAKSLTGKGAKTVASSREAAEASEIIIMVPDTPHVEAVLFGDDGVAEGLSAGKAAIDRTFDPRIRIELHQKSLNLALSSVRAMNMGLPNTATAQELCNACAAHGGSGWDHLVLVKALERMADHDVAWGDTGSSWTDEPEPVAKAVALAFGSSCVLRYLFQVSTLADARLKRPR